MTFCSGGPRPSDKGGGGYPVIQTLRLGGGPGLKIFLVWSKNMGGASPQAPPLDPPLFWLLDQTLPH